MSARSGPRAWRPISRQRHGVDRRNSQGCRRRIPWSRTSSTTSWQSAEPTTSASFDTAPTLRRTGCTSSGTRYGRPSRSVKRQRPRRDDGVVPCSFGGDGGESNSPSKTFCRRPLRAYPMICRRSVVPASAPWRRIQSRPLAGLTPSYVTLTRSASPLNDASTARGDEAASTLTLRP